MTDFAELVLKADTTGLVQGEAALDNLTNAGRKAETQAVRLQKTTAQAGAAMTTYGAATRSSGGYTANLAAQFNDIGVMLAAGQSPLMLAVQQGTQINQVFAQMRASGQSAFAGVVSGITSMINPMSLATIGIIAGGAALAQWAMSALGASERTDELADAMDRLKESTEDAAIELERIRLGLDNTEQAMAARIIEDARARIAELTADLVHFEEMWQSVGNDPNSTFKNIVESIRAQIAEQEQIIATTQAAIRENQRLNDELENAKNLTGDIADAAREIAGNLAMSLPHAGTLIARMQRVATEAWRAVAGVAALRDFNSQSARGSKQYSGRGTFRGDEANTPSSEDGRFVYVPPEVGGGGGGTSARDAVADLSDELVEATRRADNLRNATSQTFADIVTGAQSAGDALSSLLANFAGMFANAAFGGLFKSVGLFDVFGGLLSFDGGGYTGGGARSGGVDGKGGFPAILHPNETVIDHTRGGGSGGGSVHVTVSVGRDGSIMPVIESVAGNVAANVTRSAIQQYDRSILPQSVRRVQADPRRIG